MIYPYSFRDSRSLGLPSSGDPIKAYELAEKP
jgi:hypothetical protein